ncbi:MAG: hypothetical protein ACOC0P_03060 [Planctomycetota bacterium]
MRWSRSGRTYRQPHHACHRTIVMQADDALAARGPLDYPLVRSLAGSSNALNEDVNCCTQFRAAQVSIE